jgi:asparagine synthase (glutamine-hydrolysing)
MFAFGLYDGRAHTLFLARDRAGEKPCYYHHAKGRFSFASELKALMVDPALPRTLDLEALEHYLAYGYVPANLCILQGIRKLEQGQAALYDVDKDLLRLWHYWQLPPPLEEQLASPAELEDELRALLMDAVHRQLIADVPVGILLSGGVDSSLVAALATQVSSHPVRTFTVSFPGYGAYDESAYANRVAMHLGTNHLELEARPTAVTLLADLARQYDEPLADSSILPTYLVSRLVREHCTVALGGDGGDELFGGYLHYHWIDRQALARRFVPGWLRSVIAATVLRCVPHGVRGRGFLTALNGRLSHSVARANMLFDGHARRQMVLPLRTRVGCRDPEVLKDSLCNPAWSALQQATAVDFRTYLVDDILVKVDRASMLNSLEMRAPWLDYRITEFAFSRLPDEQRAIKGERKILPRKVAAAILPSDLNLRRKHGFSIPLKAWFHEGWGAYFKSVLDEVDPRLFDKKAIERLLLAESLGLERTSHLFALVMFELWRREYRISV